MTPRLSYAILSMDAYNRGYLPAITNMPVGTIGGTIIRSDVPLPEGSEPAGFFAQAYTLANGKTVISYRGTNTDNGTPLGDDVANGWTLGGGVFNSQAQLAIKFYRAIVGETAGVANNPYAANITTTGHSLGGGLAGFVATLYGKEAYIYDTMAYRFGAENVRNVSLSEPALKDFVYGQYAVRPLNSGKIDASEIEGQGLGIIDGVFASANTSYSLGNTGLFGIGPIERHSQALLVTRLYADEAVPQIFWENATAYLWKAYFNDAVADNLPGIGDRTGAGYTALATMQSAIAYSAIKTGTRPFGDTAIDAMFDDAGNLGRALGLSNVSTSLRNSAGSIANVFVQFAGGLALQGKTKDLTPSVVKGVLSESSDQSVMTVDLRDSTWTNAGAPATIVGRAEIVNNALSFSNISASFRPSAIDFDRVSYAVSNAGSNVELNPVAAGRYSLFVGADGTDTVVGGNGRNVILGGKGDDRLFGGNGNDIIDGGDGDDLLYGGVGNDVIFGGNGFDILLMSGLDASTAPVNLTLSKIAETDTTPVGFRATNANTGDIERAFGVEAVALGNGNDRLNVKSLGPKTILGQATNPTPLLKTIAYFDFMRNDVSIEGVYDPYKVGDTLDLTAISDDLSVDIRDLRNQTVNYQGLIAPLGDELVVRNAKTVFLGAGNDQFAAGATNGGLFIDPGAGDDTITLDGWGTFTNTWSIKFGWDYGKDEIKKVRASQFTAFGNPLTYNIVIDPAQAQDVYMVWDAANPTSQTRGDMALVFGNSSIIIPEVLGYSTAGATTVNWQSFGEIYINGVTPWIFQSQNPGHLHFSVGSIDAYRNSTPSLSAASSVSNAPSTISALDNSIPTLAPMTFATSASADLMTPNALDAFKSAQQLAQALSGFGVASSGDLTMLKIDALDYDMALIGNRPSHAISSGSMALA
jgi:Ca2+-binding RTX toxin-like protein